MNDIKRFIHTSLIYFLGNVLSKLVSLFLLPLYTSRIEPAQFGTFDLVLSLINLIAPIAFFQIWDGMFRFAFDFSEKKEKYTIINESIIIFVIGTIVYVSLFFLINQFFNFEYFLYILFYGLLFSIQYIYAYAVRVFLDNKLFVFSGIINTLVTALLNVFFITVLDWDVKSMYLSPAIGCFIQILIIEYKLKIIKHFDLKGISITSCKKMLFFSIPLCFATISYWLLSGFTRVLITIQLGAYENGVYAVANRFASMITIFVTVFQFSWNEMAYLLANDNSRNNKYSICVNLLFKSIMYGSAITCVIIKLIFPYFIDFNYYSALNLIPLAIFGVATNSIAGFLGTLFMTEKKTSFILISTVISAIINIVLGITSIKYMGIYGALISLSISFTVLLFIRLSQLEQKFNIKIKKDYLFSVFVTLLSIVVFYNNDIKYLDIICIVVLVFLFLYEVRDYILIFFRKE